LTGGRFWEKGILGEGEFEMIICLFSNPHTQKSICLKNIIAPVQQSPTVARPKKVGLAPRTKKNLEQPNQIEKM
jgi:hypothetical protein